MGGMCGAPADTDSVQTVQTSSSRPAGQKRNPYVMPNVGKFMTEFSRDTLYKILLIGDSAVGKSSMILRFSDNQFSDAFLSTVGVDFKIRDFEIDGDIVKLQIWDTAGQERFRTITSSFFRGAHAIVVVYDITKSQSLHSVSKWLEEIDRAAPPNVKRILVGNKCDLVKERQVETNEGKALAKERDMQFFETSAKEATNIKEVFGTVAKLVHAQS